MAEQNTAIDSSGQYLPASHYKIRVIGGMGICVLVMVGALLIVNMSKSVSGDNIVTLFGMVITLISFTLLTQFDPVAKSRTGSTLTDLLLNIAASVILGVAANVLYAAVTK